jgi:transaldolase
MKFFIDTANLDQIKEAASWGVLDGVTTNPTLLAREGVEPYKRIKEICKVVPGPVSAEIVSLEHKKMVTEAKKVAKIAENVVIKVPLTVDGVKSMVSLSELGIKTNATLVFSSNQALLAAKAGATFVSPFIGRLDDASHVGMDLIREIVSIYENYDFDTEVLVASIRNPLHIVDAAMTGADVVTVPFSVIQLMVKHPLTDIGLKKFLGDWEVLQKKV